MNSFPKRNDVTPDPGPETSYITPQLDIAGRHGAGFVFLFSPTFRCISGYDWRRGASGRLEPHAHSFNLVSGRKTVAWMHHGFMPHILWPRGDDRYDLFAVLGTWGPRSEWGDGSEAAYPAYGVARTKRVHPDRPWEDGIAIDLDFVDGNGAVRSFRDDTWTFLLRPGSVRFRRETDSAEVLLVAPPDENHALRIIVRPPPDVAAVRLLARVILRKVVLPPPEYDEPVNVLDAPFGFGKFTTHTLRFDEHDNGARFVSDEEGIALRWTVFPSPVSCGVAPADLYSPERSDDAEPALLGNEGSAFDVVLEAAPSRPASGSGKACVEFLFRAEPADAPLRSPRPSPAGVEDAAAGWWQNDRALSVRTGDSEVDGLIRWSLITARSLPWPNGAIATGALGYGGCGHVGQDIPFCYVDYLADDHPVLRRAAERSIAQIWEHPRRGELPGITDHPCTGFDFAFQPFDPWTARVWKSEGACGFLRQVISLHEYWAFTGDDHRARRYFEVADAVYRRVYRPFEPTSTLWTGGQETQAAVFTLTVAPRALHLAARMAAAFGGDPAPYLEDASRARDVLNRPLGEGGLVLESDRADAEGRVIPAGLLLGPFASHLHPSYDVPLYNAIAITEGALTEERRRRVAEVLADRDNGWWVEGMGLAKQNDGLRGIWFWHNSIAAGALARCGDIDPRYVDAAADLMRWMGSAVADINGIGCPGEDLNGGDYAMGVGCLAPIYFLRGFLGMTAHREGLDFDPVLPRRWEGISVRNLFYQGRRRDLTVRRDAVTRPEVSENSDGHIEFRVP